MRERTETVHRKGTPVHIGNLIRILEVPASVSAETSPAALPLLAPATPAIPVAEPALPELAPAETALPESVSIAARSPWAR